MIVHLPTPHDHFSPRTGSATMTVINGLAGGTQGGRHRVLVSHGSYSERYDTADVLEYTAGPWVSGPRARADAIGARLGVGRPFQRAAYGDAVSVLPSDEHSLLLHNAPYVAGLAPRHAHPVLYAHNEVLPGSRPAVARGLAGMAGVIAVSTWLAERLRDRAPRSLRERIVPLVNGVDTTAFRPSPRERRERLRLLFIGRVVPEKGADLLLAACSRLADPDIDVRIVGSAGFSPSGQLTPYEVSLRQQATSMPGNVEFVPFVDRFGVPSHYAWADAVILPARWNDPCPLTLLEAMASGAATIISESGGMPEAAGGSAIMVPRDDVDRLAEAIGSLSAEDQLLDLRRRARARALQLDWASRSVALDTILMGFGAPRS